ncbi:NDT-like domain-containing protein raw isoform 2-T8 [Glossina fuscipes fuscipes]
MPTINNNKCKTAILLASSNPGTTIGCIKSSASISTLAKQLQPIANRETRCSITSIHSTTTYRSNSSSALLTTNNMRPQTLNVHNRRQNPTDHTQSFLGEVLAAWRAKARWNIVPAERTQELFQELSFHPNDEQISDMLQTAKMLARKSSRHSNGLTFGEFCVLAADLKRFRTSSFGTSSPGYCDKVNLLSSVSGGTKGDYNDDDEAKTKCSFSGGELRSTKSLSNVEDCKKLDSTTTNSGSTSAPVEVFLGGSCNPTTWRADVAIPALKKLGISFYNPQVSDWTPDLIELEHRAKEKARVLFFVMDSETRASAGAIEVAHIAGQNCKQLVLVLHPYKPSQRILNEHISQQEYIDLTRNQLILRELVTRRGLPVLDNIPSGLQRTKDVLAGFRDPPTNIASILIVVRGAFDRVNPVYDVITIEQCQRALLYLGYTQSLVKLDNLSKIISDQRESLSSLKDIEATGANAPNFNMNSTSSVAQQNAATASEGQAFSEFSDLIDFNLFCVIFAYLSVLQQEIHESGCISPIKGINVPPPPVYLTNMQGEGRLATNYFTNKNASPIGINGIVSSSEEGGQNVSESSNRDSGTSSPQPAESLKSHSQIHLGKPSKKSVLLNVATTKTTAITTTLTKQSNTSAPIANLTLLNNKDNTIAQDMATNEEESDSTDSVFSSSSSINSISCCEPSKSYIAPDFREVYLGGSCYLRTKWRQDLAIPCLKANGISYHLPSLHESLNPRELNWSEDQPKTENSSLHKAQAQPNATASNFMRTRRKYRTTSAHKATNTEEVTTTISEETLSWSLSPVRTNLFNPALLDSSRVLLFVITNETRSLAPMTLAAHCIGLMYNVVLAVQMLPDNCVIGNEKLTPAAIKDYNRGRSYLIDLAKRQGVPVFHNIQSALDCVVEKINSYQSKRND